MSHDLEQAQIQQQQTPPPPQTLIGASGKVADNVVTTLGAEPLMLVVVLLNAAFLGAGSYYLASLEGYRHAERLKSISAFDRCIASSSVYGPGRAPPTP